MSITRLDVADQFDYLDGTIPRAAMAVLVSGGQRYVTITEWPQTLLAMARLGMLVGQARRDADALMTTEEGPAHAEATQGHHQEDRPARRGNRGRPRSPRRR